MAGTLIHSYLLSSIPQRGRTQNITKTLLTKHTTAACKNKYTTAACKNEMQSTVRCTNMSSAENRNDNAQAPHWEGPRAVSPCCGDTLGAQSLPVTVSAPQGHVQQCGDSGTSSWSPRPPRGCCFSPGLVRSLQSLEQCVLTPCCSSSSQLGKVCAGTVLSPAPSQAHTDLLENIILRGSRAKCCQSNLKSI